MTTRLPSRNPTQREVFEAIEQILLGRLNNVGTITLTENVTTSTITNRIIHENSVITFSSKTANAATELANLYISAKANGSATITHSNLSSTDRTYDYVIHG